LASSSGRAWALLATLFAAALVASDVAPALRGPAPYPPEWRWELREAPPGSPLPALACAAGLLVLVGLSSHRSASGRSRHLLIAGGILLGWAFSLALLAREPGGACATLLQRASSRTITSYYTVAVSPMADDPLSFLAHHAELLPDLRKTAKHAATHPPGPVLFYRTLLAGCRAWPGPCDLLLRAAGLARTDRDAAARATALLGPLLVGLLCAATVWPLAVLGQQLGLPGPVALRLALLWPLLPGPALMVPQFDQALAFPIAAAAALLATAIATKRWPPAALAGLLAGAAMLLSYGALAFLAIAAFGAWAMHPRGPAAVARPAAAFLAGAGLVLAVLLALGHRPLASLQAALAIHREAYTAPRSYLLWIPFNLLDLAIFLGVPVAVAGLLRLRAGSSLLGTASGRYLLAVGLGVVALDVSGQVRGEVGRIWIPLMALLLPASLAEGEVAPDPGSTVALGAQLAALSLLLGQHWMVG
jgi:hypothetical protein